MKHTRHKIGTIVAWTNDGEEYTFTSAEEAYKELNIAEDEGYSFDEFCARLGAAEEVTCGTTAFRYGIDIEATKGYDDAWDEAEAYLAEQEEEADLPVSFMFL